MRTKGNIDFTAIISISGYAFYLNLQYGVMSHLSYFITDAKKTSAE